MSTIHYISSRLRITSSHSQSQIKAHTGQGLYKRWLDKENDSLQWWWSRMTFLVLVVPLVAEIQPQGYLWAHLKLLECECEL